MALKAGIVGLPNIGKSTLFNALTKAGAQSENYPFCTIEPNVGTVNVPDKRMEELSRVVNTKVVIPTICHFVDIAGLVKGASKGEGLGNKFLSHIREVDSILHIVRCFDNDNITHVSGKVDPISDIETIELELVLADLEVVEKRMGRLLKQKKSGDKESTLEYEALNKVKVVLEEGLPARSVTLDLEEDQLIKGMNLLTRKSVLYVANVSEESGVDNKYVHEVTEYAEKTNSGIVVVCAQVEAEIAELDGEDREMFMHELGIEESGLNKLIKATYDLLGLITYFTAGEKEVRAWTVRRGSSAPTAAGVIHSDFEKGFIRAEVVSYEDLLEGGSYSSAKSNGVVRIEGKDYIVKDGDVINFRFAV